MKFKQILKSLGKNLIIFLTGGFIGAVVAVLWVIGFWLPANSQEIGLGIIVVAPFMLILFSGLGLILGGIIGLILFYIKKLFFKK